MESFSIGDVAERILGQQVGVFPFDTIWGLTGLVEAEIAERISRIKKRPSSQSLVIVIPDALWVEKLVGSPTPLQKEWMKKSWPGPTTLIFGDLALRWPDFAPVNELLRLTGRPLYSTSANISGQVYPKRFEDISPEILNAVDFVFRGTEPPLGKPSNIVDVSGETARIVRA
jgi:L-threonylcarbamoyladenylate synthase